MRPCFVRRSLCLSMRAVLLGIYLGWFLVGCGSDDESTGLGAAKTLSWTAVPDSSVLGYKVYWGTESHNYESSADAGPDPSYTVNGLNPGATYFFAVSAYSAEGESALSAEVTSFVESSLVVEGGKLRRPQSGS